MNVLLISQCSKNAPIETRYNAGRWAVCILGLSSGGEGGSTGNQYCTGTAIPAAWNGP